jgi:manganese transport protein
MSAHREPDRSAVPEHEARSLAEVHRTVPVPAAASWLRRMFAFAGPAYLVSVGYMDPGNWATDLAGGARFGYRLVWVLIMSNLMAVLLQTLSARLGVVTGKDLAQACRDFYPRAMAVPLWLLCEVAIVACDLAEVLGAAIGLQLLFGVPLIWGVLLTGLDVLLLLALGRLGMRRMEALIVVLVATIGACFGIEMILSHPSMAAVFAGFVPRDEGGRPTLFAHGPGGWQVLGLDRSSLYVAMGILGATVMPHNLYLHSALVQSRAVEQSSEGKREACRMNLVDSVVALNAALFVNGAILVLAGAVFHYGGHQEVARLEEAHRLLAPLLGTSVASVVFAVALLCSGQSSTITGTLAGQIVMEGFLHIRIQPWLRRMISRGLAIIPAVAVILLRGPRSVDDLLVLSQVVLSMQLAFAVIPLIAFTSDREKMGEFVNKPWVIVLSVLAAILIVGLNANLVAQQIGAWLQATRAPWIQIPVIFLIGVVALLLLYVTGEPLLRALRPGLKRRPELAWVPIAAGSGPGPESRALPAEVLPAPVVPEGPPRKVAIALEMGSADDAVLEHVRSHFAVPGAELTLLHVVESAAGRYLGEESSDQESRADLATLERLADELRRRGARVTVALGHGDPKTELARLVKEVAPDLLVTGSHGHGGLRDVLFGATVSGLRHRVSCPVLTVPSSGLPRP